MLTSEIFLKRGTERLELFAEGVIEIQKKIGFKISSRGWGYQLEQYGLIDKDQFNLVEKLINDCRKKGYLPIDFVAEEKAREFDNIQIPEAETPEEFMAKYLRAAMMCEGWYTPDWWDGEKYYIQMLVEKIDLKTLFEPVCKKYKICIATSKGWSSMLQRAEYARRFKKAEEKGLTCVLLYCGDHDPDGLRISNFIHDNLYELAQVYWWDDGSEGYNPHNLIIDRFGLNYDFIAQNKLSWIDNLITGSGGYIATMVDGKIVQGRAKSGKPHPNYPLPYVQEYLYKYGVRKCEGNALVVQPDAGRKLCEEAIIKYLGPDALTRFAMKRAAIRTELHDFREDTGLDKIINDALETIKKEE